MSTCTRARKQSGMSESALNRCARRSKRWANAPETPGVYPEVAEGLRLMHDCASEVARAARHVRAEDRACGTNRYVGDGWELLEMGVGRATSRALGKLFDRQERRGRRGRRG